MPGARSSAELAQVDIGSSCELRHSSYGPCFALRLTEDACYNGHEHPENIRTCCRRCPAENELEAGMIVAALEESGIKATMSGATRPTSAPARRAGCRCSSREEDLAARGSDSRRSAQDDDDDVDWSQVDVGRAGRRAAIEYRREFAWRGRSLAHDSSPTSGAFSGPISGNIRRAAGELLSIQHGASRRVCGRGRFCRSKGVAALASIRSGEPHKLQLRTVQSSRFGEHRSRGASPCWTAYLSIAALIGGTVLGFQFVMMLLGLGHHGHGDLSGGMHGDFRRRGIVGGDRCHARWRRIGGARLDWRDSTDGDVDTSRQQLVLRSHLDSHAGGGGDVFRPGRQDGARPTGYSPLDVVRACASLVGGWRDVRRLLVVQASLQAAELRATKTSATRSACRRRFTCRFPAARPGPAKCTFRMQNRIVEYRR